MKKQLILISILVLVALGGIRIYYWVKQPSHNSHLVRAVPVGAAFFFELNQLGQLDKQYSSLPYYNTLKQLAFYRKTDDLFSLLMPMINRQSGWKDAFFNQTIVISYHLTRADNFEPVLIVDMHHAGKPDMVSLLNALGNSVSYNSRKVMNENVFDTHFIKSDKYITLTCIDKVLIISAASFLVEDGISQMAGRTSLFEQESFSRLRKSVNKNSDVALYFNYKNLAGFLGGFASMDAQSLVNSISAFASWTEVDLSLKPDGIYFEGNTTASGTNWINYFTKEAVQNNTAKILSPDNTALLLQLGLSDKDMVTDQLNPSLTQDVEYNKYIRPWMGSQMAMLLTEPINNNFLPQSFLIIETKSESQSSQLLNKWANEKKSNDTVNTTLSYNGKVINQLQVGESFNRYFNSALIQLNNPFFTTIDRKIIFSNSINQLKLLLDKYSDGNTLSKNNRSEQKNTIPCQYSVYIDLMQMKDFIRALGSDSLVLSLPGGFDAVKQFSPVQLNYSQGKEFIKTTGNILFVGSRTVTENYLWKTTLDTTALTAPQILLSARDDNKMIAIQDVNNTLYLLNKGGDIVWKKKLDAPVKGKIAQIDFYGNGQLQMVFATEGKIYLLKMDGTFVNNFPITLSAPATSPLQVIDFDGVQQYRFFVACSNKCIYGFEKSGKPLAGWNPNTGTGEVNLPVQFYKTPGKEFILAVTADGSLQFFSRDGRRVAGEIKLKTQFRSPFIFTKKNILTAIDTAGKVYYLSMDGKVKTEILTSEDSNISSLILNSSKDSVNNYVLMNSRHIWGIRNDADYTFDYEFSNYSDKQLTLLSDPLTNLAAIGVTDTASGKIYLFNDKGNLYPAFPKQGSSMFVFDDLSGNKVKVVITCINGKEVIVYEL